MRTWNDYKNHIKDSSKANREEMENIENMAAIIATIIDHRNALGISQRELASMCGMPQSSVARIESYKTTPSLDTLLRIMRPLGLMLYVSEIK